MAIGWSKFRTRQATCWASCAAVKGVLLRAWICSRRLSWRDVGYWGVAGLSWGRSYRPPSAAHHDGGTGSARREAARDRACRVVVRDL